MMRWKMYKLSSLNKDNWSLLVDQDFNVEYDIRPKFNNTTTCTPIGPVLEEPKGSDIVVTGSADIGPYGRVTSVVHRDDVDKVYVLYVQAEGEVKFGRLEKLGLVPTIPPRSNDNEMESVSEIVDRLVEGNEGEGKTYTVVSNKGEFLVKLKELWPNYVVGELMGNSQFYSPDKSKRNYNCAYWTTNDKGFGVIRLKDPILI